MFLRANKRFKDGKTHRYWSVVENRRVAGGRSVQKTLLSPGSEWRLHTTWFDRSAMADLLHDDFRLAAIDTLYRCHNRLLDHREALFSHLKDRGIPTEETLGQMRAADPSVRYLVGTPKGRLTKLEKHLAAKDWQEVKDDVHVKLLPRDGELYVLARSLPRRCKESAMRRKKLKAYWARLKELQKRDKLTRDELLLAIGAAKEKAGRNARRLVMLHLPAAGKQVTADTFRIEAHIFISFLAYCLHVTLEQYNKKAATGLSSRSVLERMSEIQMLDVIIPATDGRELRMKRYTKPEKVHHLLLDQLGFTLPAQPPPEIRNPTPVVETF